MDRIVTCVYCGEEYPNNTPTHGTKILTDHIQECKKHPLYEAKDRIRFLEDVLTKIIIDHKVEWLDHKNVKHFFYDKTTIPRQLDMVWYLTTDIETN